MTASVADLATVPSEITVSTYEGPITVSVDTAARLASGTTSPATPVVQLIVNNGSGNEVTLSDEATVVGSKVLQAIYGATLTAGWNYLLVVTFGDGAGNTQVSFTSINVPL
jgi:hypothetical protein